MLVPTKIVVIDGDKGTIYADGSTNNMTVDTDLQTFEVSGFLDPTVPYEYKDGVLTVDISGEETYYKKGSDAYKKALEKYGYSDDNKKNRTRENHSSPIFLLFHLLQIISCVPS